MFLLVDHLMIKDNEKGEIETLLDLCDSFYQAENPQGKIQWP